MKKSILSKILNRFGYISQEEATAQTGKELINYAAQPTTPRICFAYFADGEFIGWYGGTFGPVSKSPKVYTYSKEQIEVVSKNFRHKISEINRTTLKEAHKTADSLGETIGLLKFTSEDKLRGKKIELRVVICPYYDGPNPLYNTDAFKKFNAEAHAKGQKIKDKDMPFDCQCWIYADYDKIQEWANDEPTEFLQTIEA